MRLEGRVTLSDHESNFSTWRPSDPEMHEGARAESKQHVAPGIRERTERRRLDYSSYESPELLHALRLNVTVSARAINASERGETKQATRRGGNTKEEKKQRATD